MLLCTLRLFNNILKLDKDSVFLGSGSRLLESTFFSLK
jgi:hypothetical protein